MPDEYFTLAANADKAYRELQATISRHLASYMPLTASENDDKDAAPVPVWDGYADDVGEPHRVSSLRKGKAEEDYSGGDEDDPDWVRKNSPRQQEHNRKRDDEIRQYKELFGAADNWVDSKDGSGRKRCKNCGGVGYGSCVCKTCDDCGSSYYGFCKCNKKEATTMNDDPIMRQALSALHLAESVRSQFGLDEPADDPKDRCGSPAPSGKMTCILPKGHANNHYTRSDDGSTDGTWSDAAAKRMREAGSGAHDMLNALGVFDDDADSVDEIRTTGRGSNFTVKEPHDGYRQNNQLWFGTCDQCGESVTSSQLDKGVWMHSKAHPDGGETQIDYCPKGKTARRHVGAFGAANTVDVPGTGPVDVSTVNLALTGGDGYETCLFWDHGSQVVGRYSDPEEARRGHESWLNPGKIQPVIIDYNNEWK